MTINELLKATNKNEEMIAAYILKYSVDNQWNRVEQTQQPLSKCMDHIKAMARKEAKSGVAMIEDSTVYRWAIEFYNQVGHADEKSRVSNETKPKMSKASPTKEGKKDAKKDEQLSIFDLL